MAGVMEGIQIKYLYNHARYHIQMERVDSAQMQLGRWDFVEASMLMFPVAYTVAIATLLGSNGLLWLLASYFVLCIAGFPPNICIFVHQRWLSALQSVSNIR